MANTIIIKNSSVPADIPLLVDLTSGELAINTADAKLYYKKSDNTIAEVKGGPVLSVMSDLTDVTDDSTLSSQWLIADSVFNYVPQRVQYIGATTEAQTDWIVTHNLNQSYVSVKTYDNTNTEITPQSVTIIDENTILCVFASNVEGTAVVTGIPGLEAVTISEPPPAFTATAVPIDLVASCSITCTGDFEVDWGSGSFVQYASVVTASAVPSANITVRNQTGADVTYVRFITNTYSAIDLVDASSLTSMSISCQDLAGMTSFNATGTHNVVNFNSSWKNCTGLLSFPEINTSAGTLFGSTWRGCTGLTSFPIIDLGAGDDFSFAWETCTGLTSFPLLDTSIGTNFSNTWNGCTGLLTFPLINTSAGTNFNRAWSSCTGLTSFPLINTISGLDFSYTWSSCTGLTSFPAINTGLGTNFHSAWISCTELTSFPAIDTGLGTSFDSTWQNCSSMTCLTNVDTTEVGATKIDMFTGCTLLTQPDAAAITDITDAGGANWINGGTCP